MSAGGIGVSINGVLPDNFSQGAQFAGCGIELPGVGNIPVPSGKLKRRSGLCAEFGDVAAYGVHE